MQTLFPIECVHFGASRLTTQRGECLCDPDVTPTMLPECSVRYGRCNSCGNTGVCMAIRAKAAGETHWYCKECQQPIMTYLKYHWREEVIHELHEVANELNQNEFPKRTFGPSPGDPFEIAAGYLESLPNKATI